MNPTETGRSSVSLTRSYRYYFGEDKMNESDRDTYAEANSPEANEPMGDCDTCGKSKPLKELHFHIMYGMDTYSCAECRGYDEDDDQ